MDNASKSASESGSVSSPKHGTLAQGSFGEVVVVDASRAAEGPKKDGTLGLTSVGETRIVDAPPASAASSSEPVPVPQVAAATGAFTATLDAKSARDLAGLVAAATAAADSVAFAATAAAPDSVDAFDAFDARATSRMDRERSSRPTNARDAVSVLPAVTLDDASATPSLVHVEGPRFREVGTLGAGGLGEVTLAEDQDIGRHVAIKRLHDDTDPAGLIRFVEEVRVMGALDHPNIVPVHDVGRDAKGRFYFVMKRFDGETLEAIVERLRAGDAATHEQYPIGVRVELFTAMLHALQFAHARKIVHRDIKPANVMVGKCGEVAVMDWGIAKRLGNPVAEALEKASPAVPARADGAAAITARQFQTRVGALLGTPAYMAPEQARGDNHLVDERTDVYAACVVFHELLTLGHYLGGVGTLAGVLEGVQKREPATASGSFHPMQAGVPAELAWILKRGLSKRREDRYASVDEILHDLRLCQSGACRVQCPATFTKRALGAFGRLVDRHPTLVSLGFVLFLLSGFGGLVLGLVLGLVRLAVR